MRAGVRGGGEGGGEGDWEAALAAAVADGAEGRGAADPLMGLTAPGPVTPEERGDTELLGELLRSGDAVGSRVAELVAEGRLDAATIRRFGAWAREARTRVETVAGAAAGPAGGAGGAVGGSTAYEVQARRRAAAALGRLYQRMEYAWGLHHAPPPVRLLSRALEVLDAAEAQAGPEVGAVACASTAEAAAAGDVDSSGPEAAVRAELQRAFTNPTAGLDVFEAAESVAEAAGRNPPVSVTPPGGGGAEIDPPGQRLGSALRDFCTPDQLADVLEQRLQGVDDAARDLEREEAAAAAAVAGAAEGSEDWVRAVARSRDLEEVRADLLRISGQLDLLHEVTCEYLGRLHM